MIYIFVNVQKDSPINKNRKIIIMKKTNTAQMLVVFATTIIFHSSYGFEQQYRIDCDYSLSTQDKWFSNYYHRNGRVDNNLWVGGWGDVYISLIKMPVRLPVSGNVVLTGINLNLYSANWRGTPTSMEKLFWLDPWSEYSCLLYTSPSPRD